MVAREDSAAAGVGDGYGSSGGVRELVTGSGYQARFHLRQGRPFAMECAHWSAPLGVSGLYRRLHEQYGFASPVALYLASGLLECLMAGLADDDGEGCGEDRGEDRRRASVGEHDERHQRE